MPRTPRSRFAPRGEGGAPALAMTIAVIVAAIVITLLAIVVLEPILGESGGANSPGDELAAIPSDIAAADAPSFDPLAATVVPTATAPDGSSDPATTAAFAGQTPRPRLAVVGQPASVGDRTVAEIAVKPAEPTERADPRPTRTPEPPPTRTPTPRPTPTVQPTPTIAPTRESDVIAYYLAEVGADLRAWTGPSWRADGATLRSDGSAVFAQPWISGPVAPPIRGGYAVEAEFRIDGLASGYCKQSLGVIVPLPSGAFAGAGLIYECDGSGDVIGSRARISDVSDYTDGYFQDPEFAAKPLDLESGWHTLRIEVEGDTMRLLVDGDLVLTAAVTKSVVRNPENALGLWSEGVEVSVRRIAVVALADGR